AGAHALAADARRRELEEATRWRDCRTHAETILELRTHVDRMNDLLSPYEQLRIGVIGLHWDLDRQPGGMIDPVALDKRLKKLIDACNRGLAKATEESRAREEGRA
ncbi:hypothetical protein ACFQ08_10015, partial [Streptosporangium algeriense]